MPARCVGSEHFYLGRHEANSPCNITAQLRPLIGYEMHLDS
jgi:hypothetical protein